MRLSGGWEVEWKGAGPWMRMQAWLGASGDGWLKIKVKRSNTVLAMT